MQQRNGRARSRSSGLLFPRLLAAALLGFFAGCGNSAPAGPLQITLQQNPANRSRPALVEVGGLTPRELSSLRGAQLGTDQWQALFRITVGDNASPTSIPPVQGGYQVTESALTFTPLFPFDPGRAYRVAFDPARLPVHVPDRQTDVVTTVVRIPAVATEPSTVVTAVHPAADTWPENLLRLYIEFSAPMGNGSARDFVRILDQSGREVAIPFLPIDADFWNPDRTRFTLFFDPGRVKEDILPNLEIGRPLGAGRTYVLEISTDWRDAQSQPLKAAYRREFRVGPADKNPIVMSSWRLGAPEADTRDPLVVTFPKPLDHGLLARALSVETKDRRVVDGTITLEAADTRWLFTPAGPWPGGEFDLVALEVLEDPVGNRIMHPFEVQAEANKDQPPDQFRLTFRIAGPGRRGAQP